MLFAFIASYAADSLWVTFPALVLFGAGLGALVSAYRRITGVWVSATARVLVPWGALVLVVLVPAFVLSELKSAFIIGLVVFIPFLVLDMLVSASLMAMGMMMVPPSVVSLPFKLLLFVVVDGWALITTALVGSYG